MESLLHEEKIQGCKLIANVACYSLFVNFLEIFEKNSLHIIRNMKNVIQTSVLHYFHYS